VVAEFSTVTGLRPGASVEIAGVEVGKIGSITIRTTRRSWGWRSGRDRPAGGRDRLRPHPGLIGDKYISISPGASVRLIPPGGKIRDTESAVDLEGIIGQLVHGSAK